MHSATETIIEAPLELIFDTVSDLERWPELLPHYRSVRVLSRDGGRTIVKMAASRDGIPIAWVSEYRADRSAMKLHFCHLRAWTKGMEVVWNFHPLPGGAYRVEIVHDLRFRIPWLGPVVEPVIGGFFIENIAGKTLATFKRLIERRAGAAG